jgi:hypothetical protein
MVIEPAPEIRLATLAADINREHAACATALQTTLRHAIRAGELLAEAKALLPHGQWLPWLEAHFAGSERSAQAYMRVAREWPRLAAENPQHVADLSYRDALRDLAAPSLAPLFSSASPDWWTPPDLIAAVLRVFGAIDLDPCSNSHTAPRVPARQHYTAADDGLSRTWYGRVYLNPPYGRELGAWLDKLAAEYQRGHVTAAIALVPGRTDTDWFQRLRGSLLCCIRGRLRFSGCEQGAPFPSVAAYLGPIWIEWAADDVA